MGKDVTTLADIVSAYWDGLSGRGRRALVGRWLTAWGLAIQLRGRHRRCALCERSYNPTSLEALPLMQPNASGYVPFCLCAACTGAMALEVGLFGGSVGGVLGGYVAAGAESRLVVEHRVCVCGAALAIERSKT